MPERELSLDDPTAAAMMHRDQVDAHWTIRLLSVADGNACVEVLVRSPGINSPGRDACVETNR